MAAPPGATRTASARLIEQGGSAESVTPARVPDDGSPPTAERRPGQGSGSSASGLGGQQEHTTAHGPRGSRRAAVAALGTAAHPRPTVVVEPGLFDIVRSPAPPDLPSRVEIVLRDDEHRSGPGPRPETTGPRDASAPAWWIAEAERIVLALVDAGHSVSADDLHERFPHEPSATGAAFGALFARLASAGRIVEVGMVRSRRPEARRRRIILWGRP